ncbi:MAG: AzlC family ABC transporter permease [Epulopiscium sp.]|nr:AzlC family ABC transporter permease [Candidatus Epulonipiscium sp.]
MTISDKRTDIKEGIKDAFPIAIGYIPIAIAFGILAKTNQVSLMDTFLFSLMIFAGASQFAALNLIALKVAALEIILATAIMNFRHFLMSATLSTKIKNPKKGIIPLVAFGITDETFSVTAMKDGKISMLYALIVNTTAHISWVSGSIVGYLAGSILPETVQNSMGIALYSMFIAILVPSMKKSFKVIIISLSAGAIHSILNVSKLIPQGWTLIISIILASLLGVIVFSKDDGGANI